MRLKFNKEGANCILKKKHILIIEATTSGAGLEIIKSALNNGIQVTFITSNLAKYMGDKNKYIFDEINIKEIIDTTEEKYLDEAIHHINEQSTINGVISLSDSNVEVVSKICKKNGWIFMNPSAVEIARNKDLTRKYLEKINILMPKFAVIQTKEDLMSFSGESDYPFILKNTKGTGSIDVILCNNEKELFEAYDTLLVNKNEKSKIIIEEYLVGPLISVESIIWKKDVTVLGFTNRSLGSLPHFVEVSYDFPFNIGEEKSKELIELQNKIIEYLGIDYGAVHIEFIITKKGPALIEINPRLGGGLLGRMISDSLGMDIYSELIRISLNEKPVLDFKANKGASTYVIYPEKEGILKDIDISLAKKINGIKEIYLKKNIGDLVNPPVNFRGDIGHIYSVAETAELSRKYAETAKSNIYMEII